MLSSSLSALSPSTDLSTVQLEHTAADRHFHLFTPQMSLTQINLHQRAVLPFVRPPISSDMMLF